MQQNDVPHSSPEAVFGQNVHNLRTDRSWSQRDLSSRLAELGVTLDSSAISRMEKGQRAVRLMDAVAIAAVFEVRLDDLLRQPFVLDVVSRINEEVQDLRDGYYSVVDHVERFLGTQEMLSGIASKERSDETPSPEVEQARRHAHEALKNYTVSRALQSAAWNYATNGWTEEEAARQISDHGGLAGYTSYITGCGVED